MTVSINKNKKQSWKQKCKLLTTYSSRSAKTEGSLATLKRKFTGVSLLCIFCIPSWSKIHDDQVDGKVANFNVNISRWFVVVVVVLVNSALIIYFYMLENRVVLTAIYGYHTGRIYEFIRPYNCTQYVSITLCYALHLEHYRNHVTEISGNFKDPARVWFGGSEKDR